MLFIENVGNLICPTSYDLGEDFKVALLSVTEGEDKPFKYPAHLRPRRGHGGDQGGPAARTCPSGSTRCARRSRTLRPDGKWIVTSATTGQGLEEWCAELAARVAAKRVVRG